MGSYADLVVFLSVLGVGVWALGVKIGTIADKKTLNTFLDLLISFIAGKTEQVFLSRSCDVDLHLVKKSGQYCTWLESYEFKKRGNFVVVPFLLSAIVLTLSVNSKHLLERSYLFWGRKLNGGEDVCRLNFLKLFF